MKVIIKEKNERPIIIMFPTRLVLNHFTIHIASKILHEKKNIHIPSDTLHQILAEIYRCKHKWKDWELVHVEEKDSSSVIVKI